MKLDQLRKIIREEVRAAVKEELQEVMNEAVRVASRPTVEESSVVAKKPSKQELAEMIGLKTPPKPTNIEFSKNESINAMLQQTQKSMTNEEYQQVFSGTSDMVRKPNFASMMSAQMGFDPNSPAAPSGPMPGIDISKLDFVSKAKSVFDASVKKDKQRAGML